MISTILISVGVTLLALTGGTFLLAKINKDNLGIMYKLVAWFVILASVISLACSALHCVMKFYGKDIHYEMMKEKHEKKMHKKFMKEGMCHQYGNMHACGNGMYNRPEVFCNDNTETYWKKRYQQVMDSCAKK
jgi:hypothetical protein